MVFASDVSSSHRRKSLSNAMVSSSDPIEFGDRLKLSQQEKQAGKNSNIINEEIIAILDKLMEYRGLSTKQQKILLNTCLN